MSQLFNTILFNDANLISYYKLEDTSDSRGANTLTNNNSVTFTSALYANGANFSSSNTNKSLSKATSISYAGGAYSIVFWMKLLTEITSGSYWPIQLGDSVSETRLDFFYEWNGGSIQTRAGRTRTGVSNDFVVFAGALGTSNWNHFANCYDGANGTIYMNGVSKGTYASSGNGSTAETSALSLGAGTSAINFASVLMDDVGLFSRNLTNTEVKWLANNNTGNFLSFF